MDQLKISLNGVALDATLGPDGLISSKLPEGALRNGTNRLEFRMPLDRDYYGLSAKFDDIEIRRQR
jgi:hypothetical protein